MNHLAWGRRCFSRVSSKETLKETDDALVQLQLLRCWRPALLQNSCPARELLLRHLFTFAVMQRAWALGKIRVTFVSAALWSEIPHTPLCQKRMWLYLGVITTSVPGHAWPAATVCVTQSRSAHMLVDLSSLQEGRRGHYRLVGLWFCWAELLLEVMPQICQSLLFLLFSHPTRVFAEPSRTFWLLPLYHKGVKDNWESTVCISKRNFTTLFS